MSARRGASSERKRKPTDPDVGELLLDLGEHVPGDEVAALAVARELELLLEAHCGSRLRAR